MVLKQRSYRRHYLAVLASLFSDLIMSDPYYDFRWCRSAVGNLRPFCQCGLMGNLLRPNCGLMSVKISHSIFYCHVDVQVCITLFKHNSLLGYQNIGILYQPCAKLLTCKKKGNSQAILHKSIMNVLVPTTFSRASI